MVGSVNALVGICFDEVPLAQIKLFYLAQILFGFGNCFFLAQRSSRGILGEFVVDSEKGAVGIQLDRILFRLAIPK